MCMLLLMLRHLFADRWPVLGSRGAVHVTHPTAERPGKRELQSKRLCQSTYAICQMNGEQVA